MEKRIVVTGIGVVSSNAGNESELIEALEELKEGQSEVDLYNTDGLVSRIGCEIKRPLRYEDECDERTTAVAFEAIDDLYKDQTLRDMIAENSEDVVFSFATSMSGNQNMMRYVNSDTPENDEDYVYIVPDFINKISSKLGVNGPVYTTMSACAAGTAAAGIAFDAIKSGETEIAIVGGTDALTLFSSVGFSALKAISEDKCRPFDQERSGINLGEASAFIVLEELDHAVARGADIYAEVAGYAAKNEAYHITSPRPDGEGAYIAMKEALEYADINITDENVYVNAHGTGTKANDTMEIKGIEKLFPNQPNIYVSSTKAITGHCLGAAGSIELAISALALKHQFMPGTFRLDNPLETENGIHILGAETVHRPVDYVISNSFAFAGNTASIVLRKYAG